MTTRFAPAADDTSARFSNLIPPMQKMGMETSLVNSWNLRESDGRDNRVWSEWRRLDRSRYNRRLRARQRRPVRHCELICRRTIGRSICARTLRLNRHPGRHAHPAHWHASRDLGVIVDDERNSADIVSCRSCSARTLNSVEAVRSCRATASMSTPPRIISPAIARRIFGTDIAEIDDAVETGSRRERAHLIRANGRASASIRSCPRFINRSTKPVS